MNRRNWTLYPVTAVLCLVLSGPVLAADNLIANPGFETGDFTGWTLAGPVEDNTFVSTAGWNEWLPHSGDYFAALGAVGSDVFLSQDLATTAGQSYTIRFFLGSDGETPNDFTALWNGSTLLSLTDEPETPGHDLINGPPAAAYVFYSFTEVATGPTTTVQFNTRNDPGWWAFDDISVTAVPEPSSLALSGIGFATLAGYARRQRRRAVV